MGRPLVEMTTNLKSLRFGKDTVGGGNSNQPFIVRDIPEDLSDVGRTGGPDFLLRGGSLLPRIAVNDTLRISKLFFPTQKTVSRVDDASNDARTPINLIGTLFTAKQNILSLTNVNSGAGYEDFEKEDEGTGVGDFLRNNLALNQGIYTPLSTIAQTAGNALGVHLNKQGLNPFTKTTIGSEDGNTPLGLPTYLNAIAGTVDNDNTLGRKSRLEPLALRKIDKNTDGKLNLYTYSGGPGATLGVGQTKINMVSEYRTGINNSKNNFWLGEEKGNKKKNQYFTSQFIKNVISNADVGSFGKAALLDRYLKNIEGNRDIGVLLYDVPGIKTYQNSVYAPGNIKLQTNTSKLRSGINESIPPQVFTQKEIEDKVPFSKTNKTDDIKDFRKVVAPSGSDMIPNTLPYTSANKFEQRVKLGNPGANQKNRSSFTIGRRDQGAGTDRDTVKGNSLYTQALDQVNALPIYRSENVTSDAVKNDFVKFRIGIIDNNNPSEKTYIHFRAIINSLSDNYSANWNDVRYMGRGEQFFKYDGFDRTISLGWTVAAQSKQELIPMYQKLNYLASSLAPNYSDEGYMRGNLATLTIGGWCYEQPGIIQGINLEVPQESPWEISIPDASNPSTSVDGANLLTDPSVKEVPMIINVSGFNFKPIHNFIPQLQTNTFNGRAVKGGGKFVSKYGNERFIALANEGGVNNYSGGTTGKEKNEHINYIPSK